jgi:prepilin-type N-terminal cleavage/methylation domain-containing protein
MMKHFVRCHKSNERGFTLIEVVISLMILAMLSVLTTNAMRRAIDNRELVATDVARDAKLADALRVMRSDITAAYHHRDFATKLYNEARSPATPTPDPTKPTPFPTPPQDEAPRVCINPVTGQQESCTKPTPVQLTGFVGDASSLYLTTLSNVRTIRDSAESNQAKVGYFTKTCNVRSRDKVTSSKCLYRSITPNVDKELTTPGPETVLLENVEQFQLRYLGPGQDDYVDSWKTGEGAPAETKEKFPYAVEVTLTTQDKNDRKDKKTTASALIPLWFPNNEKDKKDDKKKATSDSISNAGQDQ